MKTEKQIINQIKRELKAGDYTDFDLYVDEAGWQDWMCQYTTAADGEPASEAEIREIEKIQEKAWVEYNDDLCAAEYKKALKNLAGIKTWWNRNVKPRYKTPLTAEEFKQECLSEYIETGSVEIRGMFSKTGCPLAWH
jgi:hypothetical protein